MLEASRTDEGPAPSEDLSTAMRAVADIERRRRRCIATVLSEVDELGLPVGERDRVRSKLREAINSFADGAKALLPELLEETTRAQARSLLLVEEIHTRVIAKGEPPVDGT